MIKNIRTLAIFGLLIGALPMSACTPKQGNVQEFGAAPELTASQIELYDTNCAICHGNPDSGAPQHGDMAEWDKRWKKGMDGLMQNTISGLNGMPALGACSSCTQKDFQVFIEHMSRRSVVPSDVAKK